MSTLTTQRAPRFNCDAATPGDEPAIRALLRQPMPGRLSLSLEHGPDHRGALAIAGPRYDEVVVRDGRAGGSVIGYGYRAVRSVWANGESVQAGYLGGLRCDTSLRAAFRVLGRAFGYLEAGRRPGEVPYDFTSILADNTTIRRGLEKGLPGLPRYVPIGEMLTLTMRTCRRRAGGPRRGRARPATLADAPAIAGVLADHGRRFNGQPDWGGVAGRQSSTLQAPGFGDFVVSEKQGRINACLAVWDQRGARQIVVRQMSPGLRRARPLLNVHARLTGRPALPRAGSGLALAFASHAAFDPEDAGTASALIDTARSQAFDRGIKLLSLGLPADHPCVGPITRRYKPWVTKSVIYAVARDPAAVHLDGRTVWMEIATL